MSSENVQSGRDPHKFFTINDDTQVQVGSVTGTGKTPIVFPKSFNAIPTVFLSVTSLTSTAVNYTVSPLAISKTGFTLDANPTTTTNIVTSWLAIGN